MWEKARAAEALVVPERLPFFRAHVLAMIAINRQSNRMLLQGARAIQAADAGNMAKAREFLAQALQACDDIRQAETALVPRRHRLMGMFVIPLQHTVGRGVTVHAARMGEHLGRLGKNSA